MMRRLQRCPHSVENEIEALSLDDGAPQFQPLRCGCGERNFSAFSLYRKQEYPTFVQITEDDRRESRMLKNQAVLQRFRRS